ncbi:unnamed protein product [Discula destructiva]
MADSIRVSLPTSGDENELEIGPLDEAAVSAVSGPGESQQHHRPQKRRRIPVACGACRSKKSRCDGDRPKCSSCLAQNIECVYLSPPVSATTPVPRAFLQLVESRLSQLESDVRSLRDQQSPNGSEMSDPIFGSRRGSLATYIMGDRRDSLSTYQLSTAMPEPEPEGFGELPDTTDGIGSIEFTREEDSGCYGPSSNIAFTRNIRRALYALLSRSAARQQGVDSRHSRMDLPHRPSLDVSRPSTPRPKASWPRGVGVAVGNFDGHTMDYLQLPPDGEMDALVAHFFSDTGALFPFVHGPSFKETYEIVKKNGFRKARRSWLGLLNAILAMATVTSASWSVTATERAAKAEVYYMRAKALCLDQMLHNASLETIQAVLLMSQYLQGTHRSTTTWNIHGLAVKAAFQLGLHTTSSVTQFSVLDKEMRLRTWYGCIMLDRTLSMTFGRPPAIPESYIRTPLPKAVEKTTMDLKIDNTSLLSTDFFVHTITLYKILWTVVDVLYECNINHPDGGVLPVASSILQIEHQLLAWQANLGPLSSLITPDELRNNGDCTMERRFRLILTLRYHNIRILAHRRMLDLYLASIERGQNYDAEDSMLKQVGQRSKGICFQSASDLISIVNILEHSPDSKRGLLGAWWFTLYYTFNATLTIVALMLCNHVSGGETSTPYEATGMSDRALGESLGKALACLPLIDKGNKMVDKCADFAVTLNHCLQLLDQSDSRFRLDGGHVEGVARDSATPRIHAQYGVPHAYAPIPIDTSHFDLGAMGWDTDFLSSLGNASSDGFQESDLFC